MRIIQMLSQAKRLSSDNEDEDAKLMPDIEKAKWILANDSIEAMELHYAMVEVGG